MAHYILGLVAVEDRSWLVAPAEMVARQSEMA